MPKKSFRRKGTKRNKGTNRGRRRTRKHFYNMKGCSKSCKHMGGSGCGSSGCPIAPYSWNQMNMKGGNGSCASCMKGGSFYKPAVPLPPPLINNPWTPNIKGWPGVDGVDGGRNYLSNNLYDGGDPQTMMKLGGSKKVKGGGLLPQNLVDLGRGIEFNLKSVSNTLKGYDAPVNPLPYQDQFSKTTFSANKILI